MPLLSASHSPGACSAGPNAPARELTLSEQAEGSEGPRRLSLGPLGTCACPPAPNSQCLGAGWRCSHTAEPFPTTWLASSARNMPHPTGASLSQRWWVRRCDYPSPSSSLSPRCSFPAVTMEAELESGHRRLFPPPRSPHSLRSVSLPTPCPRILGSSSTPGENLKMRLGTQSPLQHGAVF